MWLMRGIAEKPEFTNDRAVRVCANVTFASIRLLKKPFIYGILENRSWNGILLSLHKVFW